jgi:hypothetical protein
VSESVRCKQEAEVVWDKWKRNRAERENGDPKQDGKQTNERYS